MAGSIWNSLAEPPPSRATMGVWCLVAEWLNRFLRVNQYLAVGGGGLG